MNHANIFPNIINSIIWTILYFGVFVTVIISFLRNKNRIKWMKAILTILLSIIAVAKKASNALLAWNYAYIHKNAENYFKSLQVSVRIFDFLIIAFVLSLLIMFAFSRNQKNFREGRRKAGGCNPQQGKEGHGDGFA